MSLPRFTKHGQGLSAFAAATVAVMVVVILWGAVVRITSSGGGCGTHWPLCNGDFFPHHPRLATIIEFTHRASTGLCSTLALLVLAWTYLADNVPRRARIAAVVSVIFLIIEALLGRELVVRGYVENNISDARAIVQSIHFTNTMLLLAAFTVTWWWLRRPAARSVSHKSSIQPLAVTAPLLTILVGATGSVAALADTLFPSPSLRAGFAADFSAAAPLLVRMRWIHPAASVLAFFCIVALCWKSGTRIAKIVFVLLCAQFVLGIGDVLLLAPGWLQILHLLGADIFWITLVVLATESLAPTQGADSNARL